MPGTYLEEVTISKSVNLLGNTSGVMVNNDRIINPSTYAITVNGTGITATIIGFRLTSGSRGIDLTNGTAVVHGNTIDNITTAFYVNNASGVTLTAYANNVSSFTTGIGSSPSASVNARHNWWGAINPSAVATDAYD